ncbi:MAG: penicillin-binding protein activator [Acidobacteria bacterium]|nr:penicillin-binding protein activator [Acidobacteriota bacterium]
MSLAMGCGEPETVTLGAALPLSGASSLYGQQVARGVELAFDELKAKPEAPSGLELEILDTQSDPETARGVLSRLYEDGARAAIGGVTTAEAQTMIEVADASHRVLLSPWASAQELTGNSRRSFFRLWPSDSREGSLMGQYAARSLGLTTVVILAAENPYGESIYTAFETAFAEHGGKVREIFRYPAEGADLGELARKAAAAKADAVYVADYAEGVTQLVRELRGAGFRGQILTVSAFATPEALTAAGDAGEGVFITHPQFTPEDAENPRIQTFVQAYKSKYGAEPDLYAAHGYDAMLVLFEALHRGGDRAGSFWKGMRSLDGLTGVTGPIQFDERGDVQKYPRVYVVHDAHTVDHAVLVKEEQERLRARIEKLRKEREELLQRSQS